MPHAVAYNSLPDFPMVGVTWQVAHSPRKILEESPIANCWFRIRFNSEAARYVQEKTWHPSQEFTKEKDGSVVLEVSLNDTHEIKAWTLSFGPKATVLEPESLRDEIVSDVEQLLKSYQTTHRERVK